MPDPAYLYQKLHHAAGNVFRLASSPWRQRHIEPGEATSIFGCSFGDDGWHHIRATLREYDENPDIGYADTTLYRYLTQFRPAGICDLVNNLPPGTPGLPLFVYPWGTFRIGEASTNKDALASRFCGPSTAAFVAEEFERIKQLYRRLSVDGYQPWRFGHSFIGGTMLVARDGARRFVVLQGNHRSAILAHLGYRRIEVRDSPGCYPELREQDVERWALVKSGQCTVALAKRIFRFFFEANGEHIKGRLAHSSATPDRSDDLKGPARVRLL